ncbi:MAG TPA: Snf7 family protein [Nitrososphaerales archaeon]|nr:Snf7 family protein [Nitrososphaerales archaeon]
MSFISKWTKPEKASLVERVKNTIKPPPPFKSRIEQAQRKLQLQVIRLDTVSSKLRERDQALFRRIVSAVQQHDMQYSSLLSNELSQIRKISKMVSHAKLALEQIQIRMSTITELGDVVVALNPAMAVVKNVRSGLVGMVPQVDSEMEEISQLLSGILVESAQVPNSPVPLANSATDTDAQSILDEAASIVENSVKAKLPDLPATIQQEKVTDDKEEELT